MRLYCMSTKGQIIAGVIKLDDHIRDLVAVWAATGIIVVPTLAADPDPAVEIANAVVGQIDTTVS